MIKDHTNGLDKSDSATSETSDFKCRTSD